MAEDNALSWTNWLGQGKTSKVTTTSKFNFGEAPQTIGKPITNKQGDGNMEWGAIIGGLAQGLGGYMAAEKQADAARYAADLQAKQAAMANKLAMEQFAFGKEQTARANTLQDEAQAAMDEGYLLSGNMKKRTPTVATPGLAETTATAPSTSLV